LRLLFIAIPLLIQPPRQAFGLPPLQLGWELVVGLPQRVKSTNFVYRLNAFVQLGI